MIDSILEKLFKECIFTNVLDLGAGEGKQALYAAQHGARIVAVDQRAIPPACVDNANIVWIESLIHQYQMPKNAFDLVIMRNILHFLKREYVTNFFAQQVVQSLRPGGCLFIATFEKRDIVFEKSLSGYYTAEEVLALFRPLEFQEPIREVIVDNHPPYGEHQHFLVKYVGKNPQSERA